MKKTYINPTCKVRAMKIEAIMANTVLGQVGEGEEGDPGFGGEDTQGGKGNDANKGLWDE